MRGVSPQRLQPRNGGLRARSGRRRVPPAVRNPAFPFGVSKKKARSPAKKGAPPAASYGEPASQKRKESRMVRPPAFTVSGGNPFRTVGRAVALAALAFAARGAFAAADQAKSAISDVSVSRPFFNPSL